MNGADLTTDPATDSGTDSATEPVSNVTVLVEALDERARQAGSEGAGVVLRGLLGSVAESLDAMGERMGRIERRVAALGEGGTISEQIDGSLSGFNARLARLEEAFVQALDDSGAGAEAVVAEVRSVVETAVPPRDTGVETAVEMLRFQVSLLQDALEREPTDAVGPAALEAAVDRLRDDVLVAVRLETKRLNQRIESLAAALAGVAEAVDRHSEETANTLGRRATEAGRKLVTDFGRRGRRPEGAGVGLGNGAGTVTED